MLLVVAGGTIFAFLKNNGGNQMDTPTPIEEDRTEVDELGFIQGSLSFPSETIPSNMVVCAEDVNTLETTCTDTHIVGEQFTYREGYSLSVKPGVYQVYAYLPEDPDRRAYYNEFVVCGLSVECQSHEAIDIVVSAGETITDVDPQDWYQFQSSETTPQSSPEGQI